MTINWKLLFKRILCRHSKLQRIYSYKYEDDGFDAISHTLKCTECGHTKIVDYTENPGN